MPRFSPESSDTIEDFINRLQENNDLEPLRIAEIAKVADRASIALMIAKHAIGSEPVGDFERGSIFRIVYEDLANSGVPRVMDYKSNSQDSWHLFNDGVKTGIGS